jgi:Ca2+-binding RTX toxin-like protein
MLINGTSKDDNLKGTAGDDTLSGGAGDDTVNGGIGKDILNGESGKDLITFGEGEKTVNGGGGRDRLDLDFSEESKDFKLTYNEFKGESLTKGGVLDATTIEAIEQVDVASGSGDDLIDVAATTVGSTLNGGLGNDSLIGGLGNDTIRGGGDNDTFFGGRGSDQIDGGAGNSNVAVFSGDRRDYDITVGDDGVTVVNGGDTDNLTNTEYLRFDNGDFNLETEKFVSEKKDSAKKSEVKVEATASTEIVVDGEVVYFLPTNEQAQFYTTDETGKNSDQDSILDASSDYDFTGFAFFGAEPPLGDDCMTGVSPVYSFLNTDNDTYFYTTDEAEKASVTENSANCVFEGTAYYSFDTQVEGTVPVYDLYDTKLDTHFYTVSAAERDALLESPDVEPQGGGEGIAFYVEPVSEI